MDSGWGQEEDDFDPSLMLREDKKLDRLAAALGVQTLTSLLDFSILAEEYGGPGEPTYITAEQAIETLSTLAAAICDGHDAYSSRQGAFLSQLSLA